MFAEQQMGAVQFGRHMHHQIELAHRREGDLRIGDRFSQITAQAEQRIHFAVAHRLNRRHCTMPMLTRRFKTKHPFEVIEKLGRGNFSDANGAVALHIGMAAQGADTRPFLTNIAAQQ